MQQITSMISAITAYIQTVILRYAIHKNDIKTTFSESEKKMFPKEFPGMTAAKVLCTPFILIKGSSTIQQGKLFEIYGNFVPTSFGIVPEYVYREMLKRGSPLRNFLGFKTLPYLSNRDIPEYFFESETHFKKYIISSWNVDEEEFNEYCMMIDASFEYITTHKFNLSCLTDEDLKYWLTSGFIYDAHKSCTYDVNTADQSDKTNVLLILFNQAIREGIWSFSYR